MPIIDHITLPSGTTYEIVDTVARQQSSGAIVLKGETTTALVDGATTNPINLIGSNLITYPYTDTSPKTVNGVTFTADGSGGISISGTCSNVGTSYNLASSIQYTPGTYYITTGTGSQTSSYIGNEATQTNSSVEYDVVAASTLPAYIDVSNGVTYNEKIYPKIAEISSYTAKANDAVFYNKKEYVFDGTHWHEFGDMTGLGSLATKNSASGQFTPHGSVSQPTFTGNSMTSTGTVELTGAIDITDANIASSISSMVSNMYINASGNPTSANGYAISSCYTLESGKTYIFSGTNMGLSNGGTGGPSIAIYTQEITTSVQNPGAYFSVQYTFANNGDVEKTFTITGNAKYLLVCYAPSRTTNISLIRSDAYAPSGSIGAITPSGSITVNAASGSGASYTPEGSIAVNASSGTGTAYTPEGSIAVNASSGTGTAYTPEGTVSTPTISVSTAGSTKSIQTINSVGSLPALTMTVSNGNLTIGWDAGALPTKNTAFNVKTGDASYSASQPTFTGTQKKLAFTGTQKKLAFTGTQKKLEFTGTEKKLAFSGTEKKLAFSGTQKKLAFSGTQKKLAFAGTEKKLAFTGNSVTPEFVGNPVKFELDGDTANVTVTGTPTGTVSKPTFTGTQETVTVS